MSVRVSLVCDDPDCTTAIAVTWDKGHDYCAVRYDTAWKEDDDPPDYPETGTPVAIVSLDGGVTLGATGWTITRDGHWCPEHTTGGRSDL